jgi:hypothetical protein
MVKFCNRKSRTKPYSNNIEHRDSITIPAAQSTQFAWHTLHCLFEYHSVCAYFHSDILHILIENCFHGGYFSYFLHTLFTSV